MRALPILCLPLAFLACRDTPPDAANEADTTEATAPDTAISIPFEAYELPNGLDVVLHRDTSDPVVAVNLAVHVGSSREEPGRTGFAHLFEHLLFLDSENLGYGGLDEMNTRIGGEGTNGFTTTDITQYFQAVPRDALEKVIWAEADKIGYFIETVSADVLANEKQVVKNEKRQRVDNAPYGHNLYVVGKAIYPDGHPYNHQVIGSLEDLDNASLEDVRSFYQRWYGPNNVTLTISGDFDPAEAKELVGRYFGEIPRGPEVEDRAPMPATLSDDVDLLHEDTFATVPQLTLVWPTVEATHPDAPALDVLATYLTEGKKAPFNEVLVDEEQLAPFTSAFHYTKELAGEWYLLTRTNEGEDIDGLVPAIADAFARFEADGIPEADLARIKAGLETEGYGELQSALGKSIALGEANALTGDPADATRAIQRLQAVTPADVMRVYATYIQGQPRVSTSFVPQGSPELALDGAEVADVVEEVITDGEGAPVDFDPAARVIANPTPSSFDRTVEPDFGQPYDLPSPKVLQAEYGNGLEVYLLPSSEVPLVRFSLRLDAGRVRNPLDAPALAGMTAAMLEKGTVDRTTAELEDAIKDLGSEVSVSAGDRAVTVSGTTLARNFAPTMEIVKEMLTEPRWDAEEFATLQRQTAEGVTAAQGEPTRIASALVNQFGYPSTSSLHNTGLTGYGTREQVESVTLDDLKGFFASNYAFADAKLRVAGDVGLSDIAAVWDDASLPSGEPRDPVAVTRTPVEAGTIYFRDVPGAKQSVIRAFRPALSATDADYQLAQAVNFPLGGIYTSQLNTELRVNKGYTYGIRSGFSGEDGDGSFGVSTTVRSNVTKESLELIRDILRAYGPSFTENDLAELKDARIRGQALKTETLDDKLRLVSDVSDYGYPADYQAKAADAVREMSLGDFRRITEANIRPDEMVYVVVGDAETQLENVKAVGLPVVVVE